LYYFGEPNFTLQFNENNRSTAATNNVFEGDCSDLRSRKLSGKTGSAGAGKIRRFANANFRKAESPAFSLRRGECNRCGACCELVFKCPFLKKNADGSSTCGIYENRPNSCRLFPIEPRDIMEVRGTCSYYFIEKPMRLGKAS
jgi:hypothetical protein